MQNNFDITDPDTYKYADYNADLIYNGNTIYDIESKNPIKVKEFINFINTIENFLNRNSSNENKIKLSSEKIKPILDRLLKTNSYEEVIKKSELIQYQLENAEEILKNKKFNPFDERTWKFAQADAVLFINKKPIYNNVKQKECVFEPYLEENIIDSWHWGKKFFKDIHSQNYIDCICYSLLSDSTEYDDEIISTVNNYNFTKDIFDISQYCEQSLEFLADRIIECTGKQLSQYEIQKHLKNNDIKHAYTISRLLEAKEQKDYKYTVEILTDFYTSREMMTYYKRFQSAINKSYFLKAHPDAKFTILEEYKEKKGQ